MVNNVQGLLWQVGSSQAGVLFLLLPAHFSAYGMRFSGVAGAELLVPERWAKV